MQLFLLQHNLGNNCRKIGCSICLLHKNNSIQAIDIEIGVIGQVLYHFEQSVEMLFEIRVQSEEHFLCEHFCHDELFPCTVEVLNPQIQGDPAYFEDAQQNEIVCFAKHLWLGNIGTHKYL